MTYSNDFRWRVVSLIHIYDMDVHLVSDLFGPSVRTIWRWYALFQTKGIVNEDLVPQKTARWPSEVVVRVEKYVTDHPTFYIEELQQFLLHTYPELPNTSLSTICRALNFDLLLTRKKLTKAAREAAPQEVQAYFAKLKSIYSYPEQMIFIDETSKDGRDAYRRYARSKVGTKAVVRLPFSRGKRVSVMAALDCNGFFGWKATAGTFTRRRFHAAFAETVLPHLNPWPLPRSIVVMDNAKIHLYAELEQSIHQAGARLIFLPPYSPQLNPIEVCFGQLKRWIQKNANLVFPLYPERVLKVAMPMCTRNKGTTGLYEHCGYDRHGLRDDVFDAVCAG